ncbi:hypothetical protein [Clostridium botulinum]|uniref:hypothetical protein n=1 Tax=Clostridium botulinum TaxID=1491 RepID=UPI00077356DF|nr:hypothetical protein [Clostridium botulinum]MBY6931872.1 hypothetical protein [Clostridium botulinum]NFG20562.1 hypothetical protein [Clostridium botulinum]NFO81120.1 hypothetical protein [Clostridium botulinum]
MINTKRISKLKRDIKNKYGMQEYAKFVVKAEEGLFLFNLTQNPAIDNQRKKIEKELTGYKVNDYSNYSIEDILVVGDGRTEPIVIYGCLEDDEFRDIKKYSNKDNVINYSELSKEQLIEIVDM